MTPPTFQELLTSQEARFTNEQLEALLNEATPGPWVAKGRYIGTPSHMSYVAEVRDQNGNWSDTAKSRRDAALIAAAPALARALLAERKAREVEVANLKAAIQDIAENWKWWDEDRYDRCSSVVGDSIAEAEQALKGQRDE